MQKEHIRHLVIVCILNTLAAALVAFSAIGPSEKSLISAVLVFPVLVFVNGLIWLILSINKNPLFKVYRITTIGIFVLCGAIMKALNE
jgi:hypothetical protein